MKTVFGEIKKLAEVPSYSKHDRLVQGIINAIDEKVLVTDEMLPSINTMIRELRFSRDTVVALNRLSEASCMKKVRRMTFSRKF